MGWAKFEEDNREARTERYSSGNYFWTPYTSQNSHKESPYKISPRYLYQSRSTTGKKERYRYGY